MIKEKLEEALLLWKKIPSHYRALIIIIPAILIARFYNASTEEGQRQIVQKYFKVTEEEEEVANINLSEIENAFGKKDSKIQVIEYEKFDCSYCVSFNKEVMKKIKTEYIDTDKILYKKRFLIGEKTIIASVIPSCIEDKNEKWNIIEKLYETSNEWLALTSDKQVDLFREMWAQNIKTKNDDDFKKCVANSRIANMLLEQLRDETKDFDISATPSFVINGDKYSGYKTYNEFEDIINKTKPLTIE
ncbi:MAG: DsbA family protein [Rickettsiales bacterium]|nr:MAG: DsbA family protein [Rickettsiales bacterium]